jgi:hypothetical protein
VARLVQSASPYLGATLSIMYYKYCSRPPDLVVVPMKNYFNVHVPQCASDPPPAKLSAEVSDSTGGLMIVRTTSPIQYRYLTAVLGGLMLAEHRGIAL